MWAVMWEGNKSLLEGTRRKTGARLHVSGHAQPGAYATCIQCPFTFREGQCRHPSPFEVAVQNVPGEGDWTSWVLL